MQFTNNMPVNRLFRWFFEPGWLVGMFVSGAGERYRSSSEVDRDHLVDNIVDSLGNVEKPIQQRMVENLVKADPEFGKHVAEGLKL